MPRATKTTAAIASTTGYRAEIFTEQSRQRPLRKIQPNTGTLSLKRIGLLHTGQCDPGRLKLIPAGNRYTTTFKKLPTAPPSAASQTTTSA